MIQRRVGLERRRLIHFDKPRLAFAVDEDVNPKDLEAHLILNVLRLCRLLYVGYMVVAGDYRLNCQLLKELPALLTRYYLWVSLPRLLNCCEDRSEASFVALILHAASVLNEVLRLFVDGVIRKMHEKVVKVAS